jgi:hypothetical protein
LLALARNARLGFRPIAPDTRERGTTEALPALGELATDSPLVQLGACKLEWGGGAAEATGPPRQPPTLHCLQSPTLGSLPSIGGARREGGAEASKPARLSPHPLVSLLAQLEVAGVERGVGEVAVEATQPSRLPPARRPCHPSAVMSATHCVVSTIHMHARCARTPPLWLSLVSFFFKFIMELLISSPLPPTPPVQDHHHPPRESCAICRKAAGKAGPHDFYVVYITCHGVLHYPSNTPSRTVGLLQPCMWSRYW